MPPRPLAAPLLLATDGSPSAEVAKQLLYPLGTLLQSGHDQSVLVLVMVQPRLLPRRSEAPTALVGENGPPPDSQEASQLLQAIAADAPRELRITLEVRQGRPTSEILNYARLIRAGLIAVGHQGVSMGLRDLLLGSVSMAVARYAAAPVLVARARDSGEPPTWRHVLLALDGSQATQVAIALTRQLLPVGIQQLTLLSVQPPLTPQYLFGPFATPTPSWQLIHSLQEVQQEQSRQLLHQAETALHEAATLQLQTRMQMSEPGPCICELAASQGADVIILGSDRRSPLGNLRLSATADYVLHHAPCSVLLCRISQTEATIT